MSARLSALHPGSYASAVHYVDAQPDSFGDLNLDQIVAAITTGRDGDKLKPFFQTPLTDVDAIAYRHEVMQDLSAPEMGGLVRAFCDSFRVMREMIAALEKLNYPYQKAARFLAAVDLYCKATSDLRRGLGNADIHSRGLSAMRDYVVDYTASTGFQVLCEDTRQIKESLAGIRYTLMIREGSIKVGKFSDEADYGADVKSTFQRFQTGSVSAHTFELPDYAGMNHIEAGILDRVALLYPEIFQTLMAFAERNTEYVDETLMTFDREVQFYLAYIDYMKPFEKAGLAFCYPTVSADSKAVHCRATFDMALARKLVGGGEHVVCNDIDLDGPERILVVSGPNQGGKTTFARTFGQLHFLAKLGCPVPGEAATLFLFDRMYTHFEREEDIHTLSGKLQDDLIRIHDILLKATPRSIIIMNEIFTSTSLQDAIFLSRKVLETIVDRDALCVCVTFIDELSTIGPSTVSFASTVIPDDPASRTFKVIRKPADGLAYALSIAEKYRLTFGQLKERLQP
jgi:hypothetical protein